jgi:hypothetical protein
VLCTLPLRVTNWNCIIPPTTVGPPTLHLPSLLHNGHLKYIHSFWRTLYGGQTGRTVRTIYKEHIREIKPNGNTSKYAQHILDTAHNYDDIEETLKILQIAKKNKMLDMLENYCMYKITKQGIQINDAATNIYNPNYEFINKHTETDPI